MDKKQQTDAPTPFQDQVNVNLFFSGAQRRKLLDEVKKAIGEGAAVITITGDEGVGKTMICRMLEKELPSGTHCVYLPNTLESFDDVVRVLALEVGTDNADKPVSSKVLVDEIAGDLAIQERRLVVLFDQAERMYLATIERIRKMLDKINSEDVLLQIVFAGRRSLLENLEQLAICNFEDAEEKHFSLNPLGLSETYAYLNHCGQQRSTSRSKNVFTPEAAKKIYSMAQGNLRMTNMLAAKSLESADTDTSLTVLLDSVDEGRLGQPAASRKKPKKSFSLPSFRWLALAGVSLVLLLWLLVFRGEEDQGEDLATVTAESSDQTGTIARDATMEGEAEKSEEGVSIAGKNDEEAGGNTVLTSEREEDMVEQGRPVETQGKKVAGAHESTQAGKATIESQRKEELTQDSSAPLKEVVAADTADSRTAEKKSALEPEAPIGNVEARGTMKQTSKQEKPAITEAPEVEENEGSTQVSVSPLTVEEKTGALSTAGEPTEDVGEPVDQQVETTEKVVSIDTVASPQTVSEEGGEPGAEEIFEEQADLADYGEPVVFVGMKKHLPPPEADDEGAKKINKLAPAKVKISTMQDDSAVEKQNSPVDELFAARLAAGKRWLNGDNQGSHTVQLMVLTAEQAEENLKRRLQQEEYREVADKFHIVRGNSSRVYVFFGEYPDMDAARQARNTLPVFLRKHAPYAVSIEEAIKKATAEP